MYIAHTVAKARSAIRPDVTRKYLLYIQKKKSEPLGYHCERPNRVHALQSRVVRSKRHKRREESQEVDSAKRPEGAELRAANNYGALPVHLAVHAAPRPNRIEQVKPHRSDTQRHWRCARSGHPGVIPATRAACSTPSVQGAQGQEQ